MVESPPIFLGMSGYLLSRFTGAKLVFNVSISGRSRPLPWASHEFAAHRTVATARGIRIYQRSCLVTGQTQGIVDNIRYRFPGKCVELLTNGVDAAAFRRCSQPETKAQAKREFGVEGRFVVGYADSDGLAQGLDTVLDAASRFATYDDVVFAFFGDGPEKARLMRMAEERGLRNVRFYPPQPASRMAVVLASFDIGLVPLRGSICSKELCRRRCSKRWRQISPRSLC